MEHLVVGSAGTIEHWRPPTAPRLSRVLVVVRGEEETAAILRAASLIAGRTGASLEALTVFVEVPRSITDDAARPSGHDEAELTSLPVYRVRRQWRHLLGTEPVRHHLIDDGSPQAIAEVARTTGTDLIVCGLGTNGADEIPRLSTAQLCLYSDVPVFSVTHGGSGLGGPLTILADDDRVAGALRGPASWIVPDARSHWMTTTVSAEATAGADTELRVLAVRGVTAAARSLSSGPVLSAFRTARCSLLAVPVDLIRTARPRVFID